MGKRCIRVLFVFGLMILPAQVALAHHPSAGFGSGTADPVSTIPAAPMEKHRWSFGIRTEFQKFDPEHAEHHNHLSIDFILEATGEWHQKQTVLRIRDDNSGGTLVFLAPGVRANFYDRFSVFVSAGIPVIQDLNGTQHETRHLFIFGISAGL